MDAENLAAQPPVELTQDEKAYAGLAHALMISTWWIGPLVIFLSKKESRFVRFHALQALFWQLIFTFLYIGGFAIVIGVMLGSAFLSAGQQGKPPNPQEFPVAFFLIFLLFWLTTMSAMVVTFVLGIVFCLKAMRGEWKGYPVLGNWARKIVESR